MSYSSLRQRDLDFIGGAWLLRRRSYGQHAPLHSTHYTPHRSTYSQGLRLPPLDRSRADTAPFWLEDPPTAPKPPTPFWLEETSPLRSKSFNYSPFVRRQNKFNNFRGTYSHNPYLLDEDPLLHCFTQGSSHTPLWLEDDIAHLSAPEVTLAGHDVISSDDEEPFWLDEISRVSRQEGARSGAASTQSFYSKRYKKYASNGPDLTKWDRQSTEDRLQLDQTPFWLDESSALLTGRNSVVRSVSRVSRVSGAAAATTSTSAPNAYFPPSVDGVNAVKPLKSTPVVQREESCPDWLDYNSPHEKKNTQEASEPTTNPLRKSQLEQTYTSLNKDKIRREAKSGKSTRSSHEKSRRSAETKPAATTDDISDSFQSDATDFVVESPDDPPILKDRLSGEKSGNKEHQECREPSRTKLYEEHQKRVKELSVAAENESEEHLATRKPEEPVSSEGLGEIAGPDFTDFADQNDIFYM